jgi:hypothetical protein
MPIFEEDSNLPIPTWTRDEVVVLESIDDFYAAGIINMLQFLVAEEGAVLDETIDLTLVMHSVVNIHNDKYSFEQTDILLALASEFCLIDSVYDRQVLGGVELLDNAVLYLAIHGEADYALEAAVCLSSNSKSIMQVSAVMPSLSLFGHWEEFAAVIIDCMLTHRTTCSKMSILYSAIETLDVGVDSEVEFVDYIRKLCEVNLLSLEMPKSSDDEASVQLNVQAAGLFLLFSNRVELAKNLANLTV